MLSASQTKFIKSLQLKKYRKLEQSFVVEGGKNLEELLRSSLKIYRLFLTSTFFESLPTDLQKSALKIGFEEVSPKQLEKVGTLTSNNAGLAIVEMLEQEITKIDRSRSLLLLDQLNDPGNLGTIIRIADWYGIYQIVCSPETADVYNAKVISASKGSFTRVQVFYTELSEFIESDLVYGAVLDGKSVHEEKFEQPGMILIGSESHGISPELRKKITHPITIPRYGLAESLNAGIATGIICDHYKRHLG